MTVEAIKAAIEQLSEADRRKLADWFEKMEEHVFVRQGLDDLDAGRYEEYTDESLHELFDGIKRRGQERLAAGDLS